MAKNRNKKRNDSTAMEITSDQKKAVIDVPQAMDTSESAATVQSSTALTRKGKRGVQMKRTKNVRKMKAIAKAISKSEQSVVKVLKNESKTLRTQSAKKLYD